jgi:hypothetical protein
VEWGGGMSHQNLKIVEVFDSRECFVLKGKEQKVCHKTRADVVQWLALKHKFRTSMLVINKNTQINRQNNAQFTLLFLLSFQQVIPDLYNELRFLFTKESPVLLIEALYTLFVGAWDII